MKRRARVVVHARDPRLRSLILQRLAAAGDLDVEEGFDADAVIEAEGGPPGPTPREREVLGLMADGLANKEIAARLGISAHTAKFHVESLLHKLGAANRAEAVREGIRRGLIGI
jgi:two-component system, NarL family, nitrate/nitrite response regulator NarL